jgi:DUF1680 family protein
MKMKRMQIILGAIVTSLALGSSFVCIAGAADDFAKIPAAVSLKAAPFRLDEVRLLDGPFKQAQDLDVQYLLHLDPDRLLHAFRLNAGLPSGAAALRGWEAPQSEVRGHSLGHYLTACALAYASTGDERFKSRVNRLVTVLAECQKALPKMGFNAGYLSAFPESFIDRVESGRPVWAPYYTLHKIMAGLLDAHRECGNAKALEVAAKMADWVKFRMDRLTPEKIQASLDVEHGGMNEALANLYAVTGNPEHLRLARCFDHQRLFNPLARGEDRLDGFHANTQIPKFIGEARLFELTGDKRDQDIALFAWNRVALHRSYVIGGHSDREHFFPASDFAKHLSAETTETCNTYNMLKLTRHLFGWEPSGKTMDFYERALYNHILASQDPRSGMFAYLVPLKPGHFKTYSKPLDSFWCCVGTGMENHVQYGDTLYYHSDSSLYVNLFVPSELNWKAKGLVVRQETKFPESDTTSLMFRCDKPVRLALKVRNPAWAKPGIRLKLNGDAVADSAGADSYVTVDREWRAGDRVEIHLPMSLRTEPLPGTTNMVALLHGPIVLAGELGTEGIAGRDLTITNQLDMTGVPTPPAPQFVSDDPNILSKVHPVAGLPLTYETRGLGQPRDVRLIPFHKMHHQRYTVYWRVSTSQAFKTEAAAFAAAEAKRMALEARSVDAVHPGEQQSETDHRFAGEKSNTGGFQDRKWRDAPGGWFSYDLKVLPGRDHVLQCTYWGDDAGREFEILVEGQKVAVQKLNREKPGEFFEANYAIASSLTQGRDHVTVRFQALPGSTAGGIFGLRMLKP